ncbi:MAG: LexA family transcriptional regulator [Clostridia bacterium]|nr:LexA family transcriptional regulator [Clostridia bacterium]MBO7250548.1 LexA family transcriptional regulator [Clostridia bacterium]
MDYIARIKKIKSERKITNERLSELTGIPLGTLSKILAGISDSPKLANIVAIADALGCTLDYIVSGITENNNNYTLLPEEIELIEDIRQLDPHSAELVRMVVAKELERGMQSGKERSTVIIPRSAVSKKMNYSEGTSSFSRKTIPVYQMPVSAGPGVYLDDSASEEISIPDNDKTATCDFALRVSGNSMEPLYKNGDLILIEDCDSVEVGELGIFVLDGDGYFKKFGGDRLISLNPEYADILIKSFSEAVCCGKVIGKLKKR